MPELPEVEIVRQSLDKKIKQKKVKKVIVRNRNLRTKIPLNFPGYLLARVPLAASRSLSAGREALHSRTSMAARRS